MAITPSTSEVPPAAASDLVAACEEAWRTVQRRHADVPDVVVVLGTGVERGRLVKLGHWWGGRWTADGQVRGEVLLAGEALHLSPSQVFEVLLHEAAHGLNAARGIKDASRGGRYHNARFKKAAEEVGLAVSMMPPFGWAQTAVDPSVLPHYEVEIARLGDAMRIARRLSADVRLGDADADQDNAQSKDGHGTIGGEPPKVGAASCGCGRKMRMAPSVFTQGPVLCGLCGEEFSTEVQADRPAGINIVGPQRRAAINDRLLDRPQGALTREQPAAPPRGLDESSPDVIRRSGLEQLTELASAPGGVALIAELGAWRDALRHGDPRPLLATTEEELRAANAAARALLKIEGTLSGSPIEVAGREVLVGDHFVVAEHEVQLVCLDERELPPPGILGTVVEVDPVNGVVGIDFAIAGRRRLDANSPAAAALAYGYAELTPFVGAPLIDLLTLPSVDRAIDVERVAEPELGW